VPPRSFGEWIYFTSVMTTGWALENNSMAAMQMADRSTASNQQRLGCTGPGPSDRDCGFWPSARSEVKGLFRQGGLDRLEHICRGKRPRFARWPMSLDVTSAR